MRYDILFTNPVKKTQGICRAMHAVVKLIVIYFLIL